ncbi:MAG: hypothetical protein ACRBBP_04495 [Bdellovibrionales bacterium]
MEKTKDTFKIIGDFLEERSGLTLNFIGDDTLKLTQNVDGKSLQIERFGVEEVLEREDSAGKPFLQVNFFSGSKILLTKSLVGFKPAMFEGVDEKRVPNVVTTPDLLSIIEAFSEFDEGEVAEIRALRRMYFAILHGAEAVGFDLTNEKLWLTKLLPDSAAA